jgi:hypothetical protein
VAAISATRTALLAGLVGVGALASFWLVMIGRRPSRGSATAAPSTPLGQRITALRDGLTASHELISEITAELDLQTSALERIRAEAEENQRLAALHQAEADAVRRLVETSMAKAQTESTALSTRQQWIFFLAGAVLAVPLGVLGNVVYSYLQ